MKKTPAVSFLILLVTVLFVGLPAPASAQDEPDPPSRVARLNFIQGAVSFQPAGEQDWVEANPNRPLTTGDNLWADENSRGELHIGSTSLRIFSQTGLAFLNLNDQLVQIQVAQGSLNIRVRNLDSDDAYEIDTPNLAFSILRPGEYRIDVDPDGNTTTITTRSGEGEVTGGPNSYRVISGQRATFSGSNDELAYDVEPTHGFDEFDSWCRAREDREERAASARYVSRDMIGYEDLDDNGTWRVDAEYGQVWYPSGVAVGWAPYHYGHWVFVAPWGWTWVEDEPWGFAPFHYGRWIVVGGVWGWVPGPVAVRPVYAPALVAFVGGGGAGVAVGFGGGVGVAWFPLGPRDVFIPAYHVSPRYVEVANVSNTRVIERTTVVNVYNNYTVNHVTNITYMHQNNVTAVTAVSRETFVNARPVAAATIRVQPAEIAHPRVVAAAALAPSRVAVVGPNRAARVTPPAAVVARPVVTRNAPAPRAIAPARVRPVPNSPAANAGRFNAPPPSRAANPPAGHPAPEAQPNRPAVQPAPNRPGMEAQPARTPPPAAQPENESRPAPRTFTPPPPRNQTEAQPNKPANAPPNREAEPSRTPPPRNQTEEQPNKPVNAPPPNREAEPARTPPPAPARPQAEPRPQPQRQEQRTPPPKKEEKEKGKDKKDKDKKDR